MFLCLGSEFMWASLSGPSGHGFSFTLFLQDVTLKTKFMFGADTVRLEIVPSSGWLHVSVRRPELALALFRPAWKLQHLRGVESEIHWPCWICLPLRGELSGECIYQGCEGPLHWPTFHGEGSAPCWPICEPGAPWRQSTSGWNWPRKCNFPVQLSFNLIS